MKRALLIVLALGFAAPAGAGEANPLDALKLEALTATRERPLFAPTRRPPPPPPVQVEAPPPPPEPPPVEEKAVVQGPPPFELVGSVLGQGTAVALLRSKTNDKIVRVHLGEEAEGWRVGSIGLRSIALEHEGREETLALAAPQPLAGAAAATALAPDDLPPDAPVDPAATPPIPPPPMPQAGEGRREMIKMRHDP